MAQYYIAAAGSDSNNGLSPATPWLSISHVNAQSFNPGDTISFNGGDTFTGNLTPPSSGSAGNPITFNSYGVGTPLFTPASSDGILILNLHDVTVSNITIIGVNQAPISSSSINFGNMRSAGIFIENTTGGTTRYANITVTGCTIYGFVTGIFGYVTGTGATSGLDNLVITHNILPQAQANGIMLWSDDSTQTNRYSNPTIANNIIHDCQGYATQTAGIPIATGFALNGTVQYNLCYTSGYDATNSGGGPGGIVIVYSNGVTVQWNEVYNISSSSGGVDGIGVDLDIDCSNCIMRFNYSHDNQGAGFLLFESTGGNTVCFNVAINNGLLPSATGELSFQSTSGTDNIYNNTLVAYNNPSTQSRGAVTVTSTGATLNFWNNIFCGIDNLILGGNNFIFSGGSGTNTFTFEGNNYWAMGPGASFLVSINASNKTSLAAIVSAGYETLGKGQSVSPQFSYPIAGYNLNSPTTLSSLINYRLKPASALVGAGVNLNSQFSITLPATDFAGASLPASGYSIGAYNSSYTFTNFPPFVAAVLSDNPYQYIRCTDPSPTTLAPLIGDAPIFLTGALTGQPGLMKNDAADTSVKFIDTTTSYGNVKLYLAGATKVAVECLVSWNEFSTDAGCLFEANPAVGNAVGNIIALLNWTTSGKMLVAFTGNGPANKFADAPQPFTAGLHHFVFVYDTTQAVAANQISVFVDGVQLAITYEQGGTTVFSNTFPSQILTLFNRNNGASGKAGGYLQEFIVYANTIPSASRISAHYAALSASLGQTPKTIQEYLNAKAGTSGLSRQQAMNVLAGTTGLSLQQAANVYAGTTGLSIQQALNVKVGSSGTTLSTQIAASLL